MKYILFLILCIFCHQSYGNNIKHIIVIMLENRAFDHMLGHLKKNNSKIDGLWGNETCPYNPTNLSEGYVKVRWNATDVSYYDPNHNLDETTDQIFGYGPQMYPATMNGFVKNFATIDQKNNGANIMDMLDYKKSITLSLLAEEFAIFDRWYSDLPGPTEPNRMFFNSATSWGSTEGVDELLAQGYPQKTIFNSLDENGYTWRDYFTDFPTTLFFKKLRKIKYIENFRQIEFFKFDVENGDLPTYSFIEPRWFGNKNFKASDQHPPHPVSWGENLIADIYDSVRNGPKWNETLLIVTYDEHGGFYDHVPTPQKNVPAPDDHKTPSNQPQFDFKRLGIRVPTVFISPWLDKNTVIHEPIGQGNTHFCHSSFPGTLKDIFGLNNYLTKRDKWAGKWDYILNNRTEPRTNCIINVARPPIREEKDNNYYNEPISDFQRSIIYIAAGLNNHNSHEYKKNMKEAKNIKT